MEQIGAEYLDGRYLDKNPSLHVEDSPWKAGQILRMLERQNAHPLTVTEVGCGAGEILVQLSRKLPEATFAGYELSPQAFELCRTREAARVRYYNTDIADSPAKERSDVLLCIDVFEHIEDYFSFLRRLRDHARFFIFHIPLDMNTQMVARAEPLTRVRREVGHLHYFSKETALATLQDCGYEILDWFYTPNGADRPKSGRAKALQIPRKVFFKVAPNLVVRLLGGYSLMVYAAPAQ
jgi:hypothetical protein